MPPLHMGTHMTRHPQKGFGTEEDQDTQRALEDFFEKYGKTNAVRMRRTEDKKFKVGTLPLAESSAQ